MYFLALLPPPGIQRDIRSFKLEMKDRFHTKNALRLPAHITLQIPFRIPMEEEGLLQRRLAGVARGTIPFEVRLFGFGCFKPGVIFVNISNPEPIVELHRRISFGIKGIEGLITKENELRIHPHINIASRDLTKKNFDTAWKEFREREFFADFLADHFCLFRHNGKTWHLAGQYFLRQ